MKTEPEIRGLLEQAKREMKRPLIPEIKILLEERIEVLKWVLGEKTNSIIS